MYIKPGKTFCLSKRSKTMIALMKGATADQRNQFKHMMIQAELAAAIVPKSTKGDRDNKRPQGTAYNTTSTSATPSAE
jgi:hypothetical protein